MMHHQPHPIGYWHIATDELMVIQFEDSPNILKLESETISIAINFGTIFDIDYITL